MNIKFKNHQFRKFQEGGAMEAPMEEPMPQEGAPMEGGAPAGPAQGEDPMQMLMQLAQMAAQALQAQDPNMAMEVCNGLVEFVQIVQGQGQGQAPQEAPAEPVYRRGGTLVKRIRK